MHEFILDQSLLGHGAISTVGGKSSEAVITISCSSRTCAASNRHFQSPGMAAAGIRPQASRMIFLLAAPVYQHLASGIENEYGKGAAQIAVNMNSKFAFCPWMRSSSSTNARRGSR